MFGQLSNLFNAGCHFLYSQFSHYSVVESDVEPTAATPKVASSQIKGLAIPTTQVFREFAKNLENFVQHILSLFQTLSKKCASVWNRSVIPTGTPKTKEVQGTGEDSSQRQNLEKAINLLTDFITSSSDLDLEQEGLFRLSPTVQERKELNDALKQDPNLDLAQYFNTHVQSNSNMVTATSLLKALYLEYNVLKGSNIQDWLVVANQIKTKDRQELIHNISPLFASLSTEGYQLFAALISCLKTTAAHSDENKMSADNLATCIAPNLFQNTVPGLDPVSAMAQMKPLTDLIAFMITNHDAIFE